MEAQLFEQNQPEINELTEFSQFTSRRYKTFSAWQQECENEKLKDIGANHIARKAVAANLPEEVVRLMRRFLSTEYPIFTASQNDYTDAVMMVRNDPKGTFNIDRRSEMSDIGLCICGDSVTGKTSVLGLIARHLVRNYGLLDKSFTIRFVNPPDMNKLGFGTTRTKTISVLKSRDVLIIDELHKCDNEYLSSMFYEVVSHRKDEGLSTFASTALSIEQMRQNRYLVDIADKISDGHFMRIAQLVEVISFTKS